MGSGRDGGEHTEWFRCVVYGGSTFSDGLIDIVDKYLRKGDKVQVEGKLRTNKYTDRDGVERYSTEIQVRNVELLEGAPAGGGDTRGGDRGVAIVVVAIVVVVTAARRSPDR